MIRIGDEQSLTFLEFCESEVHIADMRTKTMVRWMKSGELTPAQYTAVEAEVIKRKGFYA